MEFGVRDVKTVTLREWLVVIGMMVVGCVVRLAFHDLPNFAPISALALFAGYYLRNWRLAVLVPLGAMSSSDLFLGGYDLRMMVVVYVMLASPVFLSGWLHRISSLDSEGIPSRMRSLVALLSCSLGSSILFFLVTNFAAWLWFGFYHASLSGLLNCYSQALPFFRYTISGDLSFAMVFFGGYAVALSLISHRRAERNPGLLKEAGVSSTC